MKTLILTVISIFTVITISLSTRESVIAADAKTTTAGTIFACWSTSCISAPSGTVTILLKSPDNSTIYGSCQLSVERSCCRIDGDIPSGDYYFEYTQSTSSGPCTSPVFSYTNGTTISQYVICNCP